MGASSCSAEIQSGPPDVAAHDRREFAHMVRIGNLPQIKSAFGARAAELAVSKLRQLAEERFGSVDAVPEEAQAGLIRILGAAGTARNFGEDLASIAETAIEWEGHEFHLAIEDTSPFENLNGRGGYRHADMPGGRTKQLRDDMVLASRALAALRDGALHLVWQPVIAPGSGSGVFYYEALTRFTDALSPMPNVAATIEALERTGLIRAFDRRIISMVVSELETSVDVVLAVNISGLSATHDCWWASIFERLRARRDVARRLVIEMTETAPLAKGSHQLASELHRLGCRIALDDFGVGHASVRQLLALAPDIVKVDRFFVHRAASASSQAALIHLVGLAGSLASSVVVEGIENDAEHRQAATALQILPSGSGGYGQGRFYGSPSISRPWVRSACGAPTRSFHAASSPSSGRSEQPIASGGDA